MRGKARSNPPAKGGGPGKDYVFSYSMRNDNENNLGADVFIDWVDNSSGYDGLVGLLSGQPVGRNNLRGHRIRL